MRMAIGFARPSWVSQGTAFGRADDRRSFPRRSGPAVGPLRRSGAITLFKFGIRKAD